MILCLSQWLLPSHGIKVIFLSRKNLKKERHWKPFCLCVPEYLYQDILLFITIVINSFIVGFQSYNQCTPCFTMHPFCYQCLLFPSHPLSPTHLSLGQEIFKIPPVSVQRNYSFYSLGIQMNWQRQSLACQ